jgi:hypothetical protein
MRKLFTTTLFLFVLLTSTFAKDKRKGGADPAFDKGSNTIGLALGVGLDWDNYYYSDISRTPAFNIIYDHGTIANVGPGTIGIGGIFSYKRATYSYGGKYKDIWTNYIFGVRGAYHLTLLKDKNNKFDPYAGIMLGVRINHYRDTYYNSNNTYYNYTNGYSIYGVFAGAKYNFTKAFGAFAELGYDISFFRIGMNFNF